jgi:hypothetical protein
VRSGVRIDFFVDGDVRAERAWLFKWPGTVERGQSRNLGIFWNWDALK